MYLNTAKNSANILQNYLMSQLILKKTFFRKPDINMERVDGGPKAIVKSTIKNLSHILDESEIKI